MYLDVSGSEQARTSAGTSSSAQARSATTSSRSGGFGKLDQERPSAAPSALDAVEQLPVGAQHRLGLGEQRLRVRAVQQRLDQLALLGGVLEVERRMKVEVRGRVRALVEAVVLDEPGALGLRDRRLAGLDRVERDERGSSERSPSAAQASRAGRGLGRRRGGGVAADGRGEAVPQLDVRRLLARVAPRARRAARPARRRGRRPATRRRAPTTAWRYWPE